MVGKRKEHDSKDLAGVVVDHGINDFIEGEEYVMTMADF
jgi:hypothetical protein